MGRRTVVDDKTCSKNMNKTTPVPNKDISMDESAADSLSQTVYKLTPMTAVLGVQMLCVAFGALVLVLPGRVKHS